MDTASTRRRPRAALVIASLALVTALVAACSSPGEDTSTCADLKAVAADVDQLRQVDVVADGTNALDDRIGALRRSVQALADDAGATLEAPLADLESAVTAFFDTLGSLGDRPLDQSADRLRSEIDAIGAAYGEVVSTAEAELADCDLG